MKVDFHSHSTLSDGSLAPQELADFMGERGVEIFAISDHDTLGAYGRFEPPAGSRVVTAIEINTTWRGNEVHLLGYGLPLGQSAVSELLASNRRERRARTEQMVAQLQRAGYGITMDDVLARAPGTESLGRPHVAKALIAAGMASDVDAAFRSLLRAGRPGYVPQTYVTPQTAIDRIAAAGGVAVLAHPGRLRDRALLDELARRGLQGLEVFYPSHDEDDVRFFRAKAREYGLVMTAGMDFHDIRYHTRGVGIEVDDDDLAPFLELVAAHR
ncbi:MAG TPA: PHP domain-containing protein [Verrucomicrobiae bacterium]|nr:PHP domain-containing protein [Verrucomicrobiae bacterium]